MFAFTKKEMLADLQSRDDFESNSPVRQHGGEVFGHGTLQSVHVVRNVRCFKVEVVHINNYLPSGRKPKIATLWVPTMTDRGLEHVEVPQIKKVPPKLQFGVHSFICRVLVPLYIHLDVLFSSR